MFVVSLLPSQIGIIEHKSIICPGYNAVLHIHTCIEEVQITVRPSPHAVHVSAKELQLLSLWLAIQIVGSVLNWSLSIYDQYSNNVFFSLKTVFKKLQWATLQWNGVKLDIEDIGGDEPVFLWNKKSITLAYTGNQWRFNQSRSMAHTSLCPAAVTGSC